MITAEKQQQITQALLRYIGRFASVQDAVSRLDNISIVTINRIRSNKPGLVSQQAWRRIAAQVGFYCGDWQAADTTAMLLLRSIFNDARYNCIHHGVAMSPGAGKTFAALAYLRSQEGVAYVNCSRAHTRLTLMADLLKNAGAPVPVGLPEMQQAFDLHIADANAPLFLLDNTQHLKERALKHLIRLMKWYQGKAGFVLLGDTSLPEKFHSNCGAEGSALLTGGRFIFRKRVPLADIRIVCRANGVTDTETIRRIAEKCPALHGIRDAVNTAKQGLPAAA